MPLIKSISGIRGTIGGLAGENLTPVDIVSFCAAYATWLKDYGENLQVVIGRDARISGSMVHELAVQTLLGMGIDVIDLQLSTTPTVAMSVILNQANGGIIITASHNPVEWNALKFLNDRGEFISAEAGERILSIIHHQDFSFAEVFDLGKRRYDQGAIDQHISAILNLPLVKTDEIKAKRFKVIVDCVNSTGSISIAPLLAALGCDYKLLNDDLSGNFSHNPEPLPQNLIEIANEMSQGEYDLGIVVDPDVDRLALLCEDGSMFGEEYTIVALADYILRHTKGSTVSNLSSTQALKDITLNHGEQYYASAVGEVNVVAKMKEVGAIFGGEGNGGVIYPELHYGRDALVGIALILSYFCETGKSASEIRGDMPQYVISKQKVNLEKNVDPDVVIEKLKDRYQSTEKDTEDGLKLIFPGEWVHMRKSNTEPIIRIYAESKDQSGADALAHKFVNEITELSCN
ncbi:MAG: phosphoglucosamine mutase [Saprospiraceae bacterium]|nr:phosphoglucosamine mutase [Saprospiraceae bacterium]